MGSIVVTGAAGFVGRRLVDILSAAGEQVVAIDRLPALPGLPDKAKLVVADLIEPKTYETALDGADCVIHLAAVTGKAKPEAFQRVNVDATKALLQASEAAGVRRFVFMSSIAVTFAARKSYPYADSKIAAEALVRTSSIEWTIVRPTMILGPGSPIEASLTRLSRLPVTPVFGDGRRQVEPIDVNDVVQFLAGVVRDSAAANQVVELGGPDTYRITDLLARLRERSAGSPRFAHIPLDLTRDFLAIIEGPFLKFLPFTAGQLATFANDSLATHHPLVSRHLPTRRQSPQATRT